MKGDNLINKGQAGLLVDQAAQGDLVEAQINDLIAMNLGIADVYQTAGKKLENESNAKLLSEFAKNHERFVADLTNIVVKYSGSPVTTANGSSMVKQAWVTLKAALTDGDGPILSDVAQDARTILEAYGEMMGEDLPDDVREVLRDHMSKIRLAHEKLSALSAVASN